MCLTIITNYKTRKAAIKNHKRIATKDIICWKKVYKSDIKGQYQSIHTAFIYNRGFHYTNDKFTFSFDYSWNEYRLHVYVGLHAFKDKTWISPPWSNEKLIKCIIPKGAEYFENQRYLVSNQIIIK